jgi:membrane-associated phospholipid phosphatase
MIESVSNPVTIWHLITRLGEVQHLLPAALWACWVLWRADASRLLAVRWLQGLAVAALITTASKIAFIGWGVGSVALNFTGFSGHAMFSAAIYPLLAATLASGLPDRGQKLAVLLGCALVLAIGVSRVMVGAHSGSEVVAGLLLGGSVSALALAQAGLPRLRLNFYAPLLVAAWFVLSPLQAPHLPTHSLVTQLALQLSGHPKPHTRTEMLRLGRTPLPRAGHSSALPVDWKMS